MEEKNMNAMVEVNNDDINDVITEEEVGNGTGLGMVIGSALTLAVIAGVKLGRKAIAKYRAAKKASEGSIEEIVEDDTCEQNEPMDTEEDKK